MARYELIERVGVGGMAEIFRGKAIAGGGFEKPVAIKRILPHLSQDARFVELLIAEAKTLSQLRHRNIVQIYDVGLGDDEQYFLVMEYVDGIDLGAMFDFSQRRRKKLPIEVGLHIGAEICEALDHAHRARGPDGTVLGLVHRDVSPSNVLLSRSGEVKLTDFGIAKRVEEKTGHGGVRGKFAYISPEQSRNTRVDARGDIYSLGIVLFELLTGTRLFSSLPDFDALKAVREAKVPRPSIVDPTITKELEEILLTALAAEPNDRYPSAGSFAAELRGYRYSLDSSIADPAAELAGLVAEAGRGVPEQPESEPGSMVGFEADEPTVVRIITAAGFSATDLAEAPSMLEVPSASPIDGGGHRAGADATVPGGSRGKGAPTQGADLGGRTQTSEQTNPLDPLHGFQQVAFQPTVPVDPRRGPGHPDPLMSGGYPAPAGPDRGGPPGGGPRPPGPAVAGGSPYGAPVGPHGNVSPGAPALLRPQPGRTPLVPRRWLFLILGIVAGLTIVVIVAVGAFGGGEDAPSPEAAPDAGEATDETGDDAPTLREQVRGKDGDSKATGPEERRRRRKQ